MTNERSKSRTWTRDPSAFGTSTCRTAVRSEFQWSGVHASAPAQVDSLRYSRATPEIPLRRTRSSVDVPGPSRNERSRVERSRVERTRVERSRVAKRSPLRILAVAALLAVTALLARTGSADARPSGSPTVVHVVVPGESLWSIARQVSPSGHVGPVIARLVRENGLSSASAVLRPGDALLVPSR